MAWYGGSTNRTKQQFFEQARPCKLDTMTWAHLVEPLSERFWRRYGANAMELLAAIKLDESQVELLIESAEYTRCEIEYAAKYEMILSWKIFYVDDQKFP